MSYTMEDYRRDYAREHLKDLTLEERLQGLSPEERLQGLSLEERLRGFSPEELEKFLKKIKTNNTARQRRRRGKK